MLPEFSNPPDIYYDDQESKKYNCNSRIVKIQSEITRRAIELLNIDDDSSFILDIGCGSGLSGKVLTENHLEWMGIDLSFPMLRVAQETTFACGLMVHDIGNPFPFKDDMFDHAISISAVQWLFHSFQRDHIPIQRIRNFFRSLYRIVKKSAVIQFYCSKKETEILKTEARKAGFYGGIVTDNENTKNCKSFLVLNRYKTQDVPQRQSKRLSSKNTKRAKSE